MLRLRSNLDYWMICLFACVCSRCNLPNSFQATGNLEEFQMSKPFFGQNWRNVKVVLVQWIKLFRILKCIKRAKVRKWSWFGLRHRCSTLVQAFRARARRQTIKFDRLLISSSPLSSPFVCVGRKVGRARGRRTASGSGHFFRFVGE